MSSNRSTAPAATPADVKAPLPSEGDTKSGSISQVTKVITNVVSGPITNPAQWDKLPDEIIEEFSSFFLKAKEYVNVSLASKSFNQAIPRGFFKTHYVLCNNTQQYLLRVDRLTMPHVRMGNFLILRAIDALNSGNLSQADKLIYRAMYRHGSPYAMQFVKMFSQLPGKLSSNIENLIELYEAQIFKVSKKEILSEVRDEKIADFLVTNLKKARNNQVKNCIDAYRESYKYHGHFTQKYVENFSKREIATYSPPEPSLLLIKSISRGSQINMEGFWGSAEPRDGSVWYLQGSDQKEFEQSEKMLNSLSDGDPVKSSQLFLK